MSDALGEWIAALVARDRWHRNLPADNVGGSCLERVAGGKNKEGELWNDVRISCWGRSRVWGTSCFESCYLSCVAHGPAMVQLWSRARRAVGHTFFR